MTSDFDCTFGISGQRPRWGQWPKSALDSGRVAFPTRAATRPVGTPGSLQSGVSSLDVSKGRPNFRLTSLATTSPKIQL